MPSPTPGRIVVIHRCHDCSECAYFVSPNDYGYRCYARTGKGGKGRKLVDIETIPRFCPLPKADEGKDAK